MKTYSTFATGNPHKLIRIITESTRANYESVSPEFESLNEALFETLFEA